jgi:antitoxin component YwqK of YwqJK toxin-antitoxin module
LKIFKSYSNLFLGLFLSIATVLPAMAQLQFIENKGQWDSKVNFKADVESGAFFMEQNGFTVLLHNTDDLKAMANLVHGHLAPVQLELEKHRKIATVLKSSTLHSHAYRVHFEGAMKNVSISVEKSLPTFNNYFLGNDPSKWQSNCKIFQAVTYKNMYPNIDVRYYTDAGKLKYDIIVRPGGNVNDIALKYDGVDKL